MRTSRPAGTSERGGEKGFALWRATYRIGFRPKGKRERSGSEK